VKTGTALSEDEPQRLASGRFIIAPQRRIIVFPSAPIDWLADWQASWLAG